VMAATPRSTKTIQSRRRTMYAVTGPPDPPERGAAAPLSSGDR